MVRLSDSDCERVAAFVVVKMNLIRPFLIGKLVPNLRKTDRKVR